MIALYYGKSPLSRIIQFVTWSPYSHASWVSDDNFPTREYEAWSRGVTCDAGIGATHTPGTRVDLFRVRGLTPEQDVAVERFMKRELGKGYDWMGLTNFVTRRPATPIQQLHWFCSELVFAAHASAGMRLLREVEPWKVNPGTLAMCPYLDLVRTIETKPAINLRSAP